eukprot:749591-Hanusia_phi.AAC.1
MLYLLLSASPAPPPPLTGQPLLLPLSPSLPSSSSPCAARLLAAWTACHGPAANQAPNSCCCPQKDLGMPVLRWMTPARFSVL